MKKTYLAILVILLGLIGIGYVNAIVDSSSNNGINSIAAGTWIYINDSFYCNDAKLAVHPTGVPNWYALNGYEYGCGYKDRIAYGSLWVDGNSIRIVYTINTKNSTYTPYLGQVNAVINLETLSGSGCWAWHYSSYHYGTSKYTLKIGSGPMSIVEVAKDGPDTASQ